MDFNAFFKLLTTISLLILLAACASDEGGESDSRVVVSTGDTIIPLNDLQYQLPVVVQVADSDGSPQPNAEVTINLTTISYKKGWYVHRNITGEDQNGNEILDVVNEDINSNGILDPGEDINFNGFIDYNEDTNANGVLDGDSTTDKWIKVANFECPAEDLNNNVILDAGEDVNGNGLLEPETPTITSHPDEVPTLNPGTSTIITDENGFGYLSITYPKTEASWVTVRLTATSEDGLSENKDIEDLQLFVLLADLDPEDDPPAFIYSPYGFTADCTSTN